VKFLVVKVKANRSRKGNRMIYPEPFNADEVHRSMKGPLLYEGGITQGFGDDSEECLILLTDDVADKYDANSRNMRILTRVEAEAWLSNARSIQAQPQEQVTDIDRMHSIQAKVAARIKLSKEDLNALDPDHPVVGINRRHKTVAAIFKV